MRMQIPVGRMSFRLAKAPNAIWSSIIMLYLAGKPRLLLSLQCQPSTAEAELICRKTANELGFLQLRPTVIHGDNLGTKAIAKNSNFKGRSKHFELRWRFLHHYINRGVVTIKAIKRDL
jgi:hypothetical protein